MKNKITTRSEQFQTPKPEAKSTPLTHIYMFAYKSSLVQTLKNENIEVTLILCAHTPL